MNMIEKTDDEVLAFANPLWSHLIKASNDGKYGEFVRHFSPDRSWGATTCMAPCSRGTGEPHQ